MKNYYLPNGFVKDYGGGYVISFSTEDKPFSF